MQRSFSYNRMTGFTLIELVIVIFIISLSSALIMPSLWGSAERSLKSESKRLGSTMRYIYDEAVGKKQEFLIRFDLDNNSWDFSSEAESRKFKLENSVIFRDIHIPSVGEVAAGELTLKIGPLGPDEPIILHLAKDDKEYTVSFNHISGRVKIDKGYTIAY